MADLTVFRYRFGTGLLYAIDIRVKLVSLVLISFTSLQMRFPGLSVLTLLIACLMRSARISGMVLFRELRWFLILLGVILFSRGCSFTRSPTPGLASLSVSADGFYVGALICWRLIIVVFLGVLFTATTRTHEVKAGVDWGLKPVPLIDGKRMATMIGLLIRFVPVILHQAGETADAQRARGIENRKNPVYRMIKLTVPLFRRTLQDADKLAMAMEARCYSETRTDPHLTATRNDWLVLSAVVCSCLFLRIL